MKKEIHVQGELTIGEDGHTYGTIKGACGCTIHFIVKEEKGKSLLFGLAGNPKAPSE